MKRVFLILLSVLALAACKQTRPAHDEANDARAIAKVKAAQRVIPPPVPLAPQPVDFADLDAPGVGVYIPPALGKPRPGDGCGFVPADLPTRNGHRPVFVAVRAFGLMKHDGKLLTFAADSGSVLRAAGLHARYSGGTYALELSQGEAIDATRWKGAIAIRDRYGRIVYFAAGEMRCHG